MRNQYGCATSLHDMLHCGYYAVNTGGVTYNAILSGHIDVDPRQYAFPHQIHLVQCFPFHRLAPAFIASLTSDIAVMVNRLGLFLWCKPH